MSSNIDLPAIRDRVAAFEAARQDWLGSIGKSREPAAWWEFRELARNTTLAADVRGLIEEVERLRMLVGEQ